MRPQKSKRFRENNATRIQNRFRGYYLDDINCLHCVHWKGRKKGCPFKACAYEAERLDAIKYDRIKRKRGENLLAM